MKRLILLVSCLLVGGLYAQTQPPVVTPPSPTTTPPPTPAPTTLPATLPQTTTVSTAAPVDIEFLVDCSGSMEAKVGAESQMDIAKKSIKQVIPTLPPNVPVALRVYAHRIPKTDKENSCKDTELLVSFQPLNSATFSALVDGLKPNGYTPIAYSLKAAGQDFLGKESQHVIILLSDGEETCGGDPIAEAKNLLSQGFKVTIHTIGFRVDEKTRAQLAAISNATGGSYFDAKDAASLTQNLMQATEKALLIAKPAETTRGQEIRGGNQYTEAVLLQPGIEYRLDHHQRKDQYDYFYADIKKGQSLMVTIATMDKGIEITSANQAKETTNPYAGFRILDSQFQQLDRQIVIGDRHGKKLSGVVATKDERLYILIGNEYNHMHKDSPFKIEIQNHFDANANTDAGEDIINPLEIAAGDYSQNWLSSNKDNDFFKINAKANESYTIIATPQTMELYLYLKVYDQDRVQLFSDSAPNKGAVVRIENVVPKTDGPLYVHLSGWGFYQPEKYALNIKTSAPEVGGGPLVTKPPQDRTLEATPQPLPPGALAKTEPTSQTPSKGNTMLYSLLALAVLVILGLLVLVIQLLLRKKS